MTQFSKRTLFWAPRAMAIAYIIFLSSFALDVFGEGYNLRGIVTALAVHLAPAFAFLIALIVAWRWEWIGAAFYAAAGAVYIIFIWPNPLLPVIKLNWIVTVSGPTFVVAALFLAGWLKRGELRPAGR
jgi:hypothetical protein